MSRSVKHCRVDLFDFLFVLCDFLSPSLSLCPPQTHADFHCVPLLYGARTLTQLALPSKCRVVADRLVDVDRAKRVVRLPDGSVLPYDYLVLTPGLQTQHIEQRDGEQRPIKDTHELCVHEYCE